MKLKRELGLLETTMYGVGIIIGAGIYALIGISAFYAGNSLWLSFLIAASIALLTGLSYAELSTIFPKAAAEYVYLRRAYKKEFPAFLLGWLIIFTAVVSISTVSLGFANYFSEIFGIARLNSQILIASLLIIFLSFLNLIGIKETAKVNLVFTALTILGLIIISVAGIPELGKVNYFEFPKGLGGVFIASILVFFAYLGFEDIVNVAEEARRPKKVIPRALILSILISTLLYIFTSVSSVSLVNWQELAASRAPLALVASKSFLGEKSFYLISLIALFATSSTVLGLIIVVSRMLYGMAKEKSFPKIFSSLHKKFRTPYAAIIATSFFSILFLFYGNLEKIAKITSLGALITFVNVNLVLIWLRYTKPKAKRKFKVPLNIGKYPLLAFLAIFAILTMIFQFELELLAQGLGVIIIGTLLYSFYRLKE